MFDYVFSDDDDDVDDVDDCDSDGGVDDFNVVIIVIW